MLPSAGPFPEILLVLIPIAIVIGIPLTGPLTARMSGWARLAEAYATDRECQAFMLRGRRGLFGKWMGYKGVLTYGVDGEGFYLSVSWIFKSGHRPLFIPWSDIQARQERRWMRDWLVLEMAQVPGSTFSILLADAKLLDDHGGRFSVI